jgi:hypothetical protein
MSQAQAVKMEPMAGIEPATDGLRNRCSTTELHWQLKLNKLHQAGKNALPKPDVMRSERNLFCKS